MARELPITENERLKTPQDRHERNVNIQYPLSVNSEGERQLSVGGDYLSLLTQEIIKLRESTERNLEEIKLLNARFEEAFETNIDIGDIPDES